MSEEEAQSRARRQFGNVSLQQEASRDAWGFNVLEQCWQDLRYAGRILAHTPAFTITALLVLALGTGMNTAMFNAIKAVLLTALPYPEPARMVDLAQINQDGQFINASMLDFRDWRAQNRTFEAMAVWGEAGRLTLTGDFRARRAAACSAGTGFFSM